MKRKYQRLAEVLGYELGMVKSGINLPAHKIQDIAKRQANVLWPNDSVRSKNLRSRFVSDVVWYSGVNDEV